MVMAIIGGAALTPLMGKLADAIQVSAAYTVPCVCYLVIALYAWFGARPRRAKVS